MRNYIILNNQNSNTISGLIIQELAPISKPLQRTQVETIDGRDGDIVTPLGYAAYNKKIKIGLYGNFNINDIIAYFATKGTAIFSNEPDKYYYYQIVDQIDYERLVRYRVATVTMHVQPFKYSATEGTITVDVSDTVSGEGSDIALDGTAEAPFNVLRHKGNATQQTYTGKNLFSVSFKIGGTTPPSDDNSFTLTKPDTRTSRFDFPTLLPAGTYTLSLNITANTAPNGLRLNFVRENNQNIRSTFFTGTGQKTFTVEVPTDVQMYALYFFISNDDADGSSITVTNVMLEAGSQATDYEKFVGGIPSPNPDYPQDIQVLTGDSTIKIGGKNLYNVFSIKGKDQKYSVADDGWITFYADGSNTAVAYPNLYLNPNVVLKPYTQYLLVLEVASVAGDARLTLVDFSTTGNNIGQFDYTLGGSSIDFSSLSAGDIKTYIARTRADLSNATILTRQYIRTPANTSSSLKFRLSLLEDTTVTPQSFIYEPYKEQSYVLPFGDTYLAKIGDYADEPVNVDGTWYIRRAIGKQVINSNTSINLASSYTNIEYGQVEKPTDAIFYNNNNPNYSIFHTHATQVKNISGGYDQAKWIGKAIIHANTGRYFVGFAKGTGLSAIKAALDGAVMYYPLATPTDEAITDQDLIDALDDFYNQAHAYKGHTHITAIPEGENAPAVLAVDVNEDNESTVTNAGNTTSRPILTIYGQGDIGVYINDVEVLDVALGDEEYITLDSVEMEAYKDTTANLKNRLVTGDYSKLALNAGANKIRFTGKVTKYEISKYSRWL